MTGADRQEPLSAVVGGTLGARDGAQTHTRGTYLSKRYRQVMRRRGDAKAIVALGHEILLSAYRVLDTAQPYTGPTSLNRLTAQRLTRRAVRRLQDLGYQVTIAPRTDPA